MEKEELRKKLLQELLKESLDEQKLHQLSKELLEFRSAEEKAEINQILSEAKAVIIARNPPPAIMYV